MTAERREKFVIDFESMSIVYEGGFSVPIVGMIDRFDMETDDPDEAEELLVKMAGEGIVVVMFMSDLEAAIVNTGHA
jgi:hypothetical protein